MGGGFDAFGGNQAANTGGFDAFGNNNSTTSAQDSKKPFAPAPMMGMGGGMSNMNTGMGMNNMQQQPMGYGMNQGMN